MDKVSALPENKSTPNGITMDIEAKDVITLLPPDLNTGVHLMQALKTRKSIHTFTPCEISDMQISSLLWAANGVNRPVTFKNRDGMRTAPSAKNHQEIELYVLLLSGIYKYDAPGHRLELVRPGDHRKDCGMQSFFADVPLAISLVANFALMGKYDDKKQAFYSGIDAGYVSQNIYLYCASEGLATTACGLIDRKNLHKLLHLDNAMAMISHPVGGIGTQ